VITTLPTTLTLLRRIATASLGSPWQNVGDPYADKSPLTIPPVFSLWDRVEPRSSRARPEEAAEYAAATAKHLFDRVRPPLSSLISHSQHAEREQSRMAVTGLRRYSFLALRPYELAQPWPWSPSQPQSFPPFPPFGIWG
jgi:hypothetical protein